MINMKSYIRINEAIDDNLYYKLNLWFHNNSGQKQKFIDIVSQCKQSNPDKSTIGFMLKSIGFDVEKFVDFIMDNINKREVIEDYLYIMQKTIESIIANKTNKYNIEKQ